MLSPLARTSWRDSLASPMSEATHARRTRLDAANARAFVLLVCEGAAIALGTAQMALTDLASFAATNVLSSPGRERLEWATALGAVVGGVAASAGWRRRPRMMRAAARALSPGLLWAPAPALLTYRPWVHREVPCVLAMAAVVLLSCPLLRLAERGLRELGMARRIKAAVARWPDLGCGATRAAVAIACCLLAFCVGFYAIRSHHKIQTSTLDLGLFDNLFWNALHGRPFYAPSANGRDHSFLAVHAVFLLYVLLPLYAIAPCPETLLVVQAELVSFSALPLYLLAERHLGPRVGAILALAFLLYPPLQAPAFYDFHFVVLAPFFILWGAYFLDRRRWAPFWSCVLLAMACREDVALGLAAVGAGLALFSPRRWSGLALAMIAGVYFVGVKGAVMPHFGSTSFLWIYRDLVPPPGTGDFGAVLGTIATNPIYVLSTVLVADKLVYALQLLIPVAFLPLRGHALRRAWFLLLPGALVTLLSTRYPAAVQIRCQYVAHFVPYVFLATIASLAGTGRRGAVDCPALCALVLGTALSSVQFGAFQRYAFWSGFRRVDFTWNAEEAGRLGRLRQLASAIPPGSSVSASEPEGAHLGARSELFALKDGVNGADYIFFSFRSLGFGRTRELLRGALQGGEYGLVREVGDFALLARGASVDRNSALVGRLR